jgi:hypothetical protein
MLAEKALDVADENDESPPYCAVMLCTPYARLDVEYEAVPEITETVPSGVAPSRKVTIPVGVPDPDVTVTLNARLWP